jgi:thiamine-monophosphate kinase
MHRSERQLIARLRRRTRSSKSSGVTLGIGDDCAVLEIPRGHEAVVTTDFSLEGVHFRREWQTPECVGHRCLTRGLSDIAAMGGTPLAAFLSLAIPGSIPGAWVTRFFSGLLGLARKHKLELAGGDTAQSPGGVLADITVVGFVRRGRALLRSGARAGDLIYVTGSLGESAAVLQLLTGGKIRRRDVFPQPRIAVGQSLGEEGIASAAIDISDGLSTDLSHICEESGVGAVIDAALIPISASARHSRKALDLALHGGEDYELLFTASEKIRVPERIAGVKITRIGQITGKRGMRLMREGRERPLIARGWEHFSGPRVS